MMDAGERLCGAPRILLLVEECNVRHLASRGLGVHADSMPFVQRDRRVIAMTHGATHEYARVAHAMLPLPELCLGNFRDCAVIFHFDEPIRESRTHPHALSAEAVELCNRV